MLSGVTWTEFGIGLVTLAGIYYLVFGYFFYREEIISLLKPNLNKNSRNRLQKKTENIVTETIKTTLNSNPSSYQVPNIHSNPPRIYNPLPEAYPSTFFPSNEKPSFPNQEDSKQDSAKPFILNPIEEAIFIDQAVLIPQTIPWQEPDLLTITPKAEKLQQPIQEMNGEVTKNAERATSSALSESLDPPVQKPKSKPRKGKSRSDRGEEDFIKIPRKQRPVKTQVLEQIRSKETLSKANLPNESLPTVPISTVALPKMPTRITLDFSAYGDPDLV